MNRSFPRGLLALAALVALLVLPARMGWTIQKLPIPGQSPTPVTDSLQLVIQDCTEQHNPMPGTKVGLSHRRDGVLIASYLLTADDQARCKFVIPGLLPNDSAYVSLLPPGFDTRDDSHRYRYFGAPPTPTAVTVGVWDVGQSLSVGCYDEHAFLPEETVLCRYRPTVE